MDQNKKQILQEQVAKLDEVLQTLEADFDCDNEIPEEYSFLSIVKGIPAVWANNKQV